MRLAVLFIATAFIAVSGRLGLPAAAQDVFSVNTPGGTGPGDSFNAGTAAPGTGADRFAAPPACRELDRVRAEATEQYSQAVQRCPAEGQRHYDCNSAALRTYQMTVAEAENRCRIALHQPPVSTYEPPAVSHGPDFPLPAPLARGLADGTCHYVDRVHIDCDAPHAAGDKGLRRLPAPATTAKTAPDDLKLLQAMDDCLRSGIPGIGRYQPQPSKAGAYYRSPKFEAARAGTVEYENGYTPDGVYYGWINDGKWDGGTIRYNPAYLDGLAAQGLGATRVEVLASALAQHVLALRDAASHLDADRTALLSARVEAKRRGLTGLSPAAWRRLAGQVGLAMRISVRDQIIGFLTECVDFQELVRADRNGADDPLAAVAQFALMVRPATARGQSSLFNSGRTGRLPASVENPNSLDETRIAANDTALTGRDAGVLAPDQERLGRYRNTVNEAASRFNQARSLCPAAAGLARNTCLKTAENTYWRSINGALGLE